MKTLMHFANGMKVERDLNEKGKEIWRLEVDGKLPLGPDELRNAADEAELFVTQMRAVADKIEADHAPMEA